MQEELGMIHLDGSSSQAMYRWQSSNYIIIININYLQPNCFFIVERIGLNVPISMCVCMNQFSRESPREVRLVGQIEFEFVVKDFKPSFGTILKIDGQFPSIFKFIRALRGSRVWLSGHKRVELLKLN